MNHPPQQPHGYGAPQPNPYTAPQAAQLETAAQAYSRVPFYRRNGPISALLFLGLVFGFVAPFVLSSVAVALGAAGPAIIGTVAGSPLLAACIVVLTGPVYFDAFAALGQLKTWGVGNKIVAAIMLLGWLGKVVNSFL
jgi:uncharacterized membrane protein